MAKRNKFSGEIPEGKIEEFFDSAQGRRSSLLIITDESQGLLSRCVEEGWLTFQKQTGKFSRPWYRITIKTIEEFRELSKDEQSQIAHQESLEKIEESEIKAEESRAQTVIENRTIDKI